MTERAATWIDGIAVAGQDLRLLTAALGTPDGSLSARSGVRPNSANDLLVSALGTPNMSVNVAAGQAMVDGTESFAQGMFLVTNDGTVNLAIAAADATNPRRDLIVARVYGETVLVGSRRFALEVVTGSPAASPVDPATPANSLVLARVTVAAAATSITSGAIADIRPFATALGGVVPCISSARPASPYVGMHIYELDTLRTRSWDGSTWQMQSPRNTVQRSTTATAGPTSGTAELVIASVTLPSVPYATSVLLTAGTFPSGFTVSSDIFDIRLYVGGTLVRTTRTNGNQGNASVSVGDSVSIAASTATTVELRAVRTGGTGTMTVSPNASFTYVSALVTPA